MEEESGEAEDISHELEIFPRVVATLVGILAGVIGSYAVFVSDNQAGTAVLLLASVAFLVIGIQGTPLTKFGSGDNSILLAKVRKSVQRDVKRKAVEVRASGLPEAADVLEDFAEELENESPQSSHIIRSIGYQKRVGEALQEALPAGSVKRADEIRSLFDFIVRTPGGGRFGVRAIYRKNRPLSVSDIRSLIKSSRGDSRERIVIVTNAVVSGNVEKFIKEGALDFRDVAIVSWNDVRDNERLTSTFLG